MRKLQKRWYAAALAVPTVAGIGLTRVASADDATTPTTGATATTGSGSTTGWPAASSNAAVSNVGTQSSGTGASTTPGYPFAGLWTTDISSAPLDPDQSSATDLAKQVAEAYGGNAAVNSDSYNIPIYKVNNSTPKKNISFNDCQGKGYQPPELTAADGPFTNVPVADNAKPANGTDASVAFYNTDTGDLWELWNYNASSGSACWGGKMNVKTQTTFPGTTGASATGLPVSAGAITPADVEHAKQTGDFGHPMYLVVRQARQYQTFSWPAKRSDGDAAAPAPVEGSRFRLSKDVDVNSSNMTPFAKMVANTAKKYGFIVSDKGGAVGISTTVDDEFWKQQFGSTPNYMQLANFPWSKMQALPLNYGQNGASSGDASSASGSSSATPSDSASGSASASDGASASASASDSASATTTTP